MHLLQITRTVKNSLAQDILESFPYLAQNANGDSYLYRNHPTMDHRGHWEGDKHASDPVLKKPYCHDWEQSVLCFDTSQKFEEIGDGAFYVPITDRKSTTFKEAFTKASVELHGVFMRTTS